MQPIIPDVSTLAAAVNPVMAIIAIGGSLVLSLLIAWVYKATHRGLSYSQSFQFALVLLGMLGAVVMMIATRSIIAAVGILGAFSLIRFRTAVKDPKDMAYILFVLCIGLAMGAQQYTLALITAAAVSIVVLVLTYMNFGSTSKHESILRLMCKGEKDSSVNVQHFESTLEKLAEHVRLLSAHAHGDRLELTYGVRPRRNQTSLAVLEAIRKEKGVEDAELFDAKNQVEF